MDRVERLPIQRGSAEKTHNGYTILVDYTLFKSHLSDIPEHDFIELINHRRNSDSMIDVYESLCFVMEHAIDYKVVIEPNNYYDNFNKVFLFFATLPDTKAIEYKMRFYNKL